jgi:hypothetical protein
MKEETKEKVYEASQGNGDVSRIKRQIVDLVKRYHGNVSFAELEQNIEGFKGDFLWGAADKNVFFWFTLSESAVNALDQLFHEDAIEIKPTSLLVYMFDGAVPEVPIARQFRRNYKKKRWLPVVINPFG